MLVVWKKHPLYMTSEHTLALSLVTATSSKPLNIYAWLKHILFFAKYCLLVRKQLFSYTVVPLVTNKQLMNIFKKKKSPYHI